MPVEFKDDNASLYAYHLGIVVLGWPSNGMKSSRPKIEISPVLRTCSCTASRCLVKLTVASAPAVSCLLLYTSGLPDARVTTGLAGFAVTARLLEYIQRDLHPARGPTSKPVILQIAGALVALFPLYIARPVAHS